VAAAASAGCAAGGPAPAARPRAPESLACSAVAWRLLYANDERGEPRLGRRDDLLAALRRGSPVRVGWSEASPREGWSVEEFSGAQFVNVMGGRDVVAQLDDAYIQTHYLESSKAGPRAPVVEWRATLSTDGRFVAVMVDRETGRPARRLVQRTSASWYALAPDPACDRRPSPPARGEHRNELVDDVRFGEPPPPAR
jgi:hypothetical protein